LGISAGEESLVGARQKIRALNFSSSQQGNLRENNQIACRKRRLAVGSGKLKKGFAPGLPSKSIAALFESMRPGA
jgi:hypothetical protein